MVIGTPRHHPLRAAPCRSAFAWMTTALALGALAIGIAPVTAPAQGVPDPQPAAGTPPGDTIPAAAVERASMGKREAVDKEVQPRLLNGTEIGMMIQSHYPPHLVRAGVTGRSLVRFVVDRDGGVRPGSIEVVSATRSDFRDPSAAVVAMMRFDPVRIGKRPVPVLVQIPINWTLMQQRTP